MPNEVSQQQVKQDSAVDNSGASYANLRDVYNAPVTHQTIVHDKSVTYSVNQEDVQGLEKFSKLVLGLLGEGNAKITAVATILLGGGGIFANTSPSVDLPASWRTPILLVSMLLILVGAALVSALQFKEKSRCTKCKVNYAMKEHGEPTVRETPRRGGIQQSVTRLYRCANCGHESSKTHNEFLADEPEDAD